MEAVGTSHVERRVLTIRMGTRRFTRPTNGLSRKIENPRHMLPSVRALQRLPHALRMSPAMAAEVFRDLWDVEWINWPDRRAGAHG